MFLVNLSDCTSYKAGWLLLTDDVSFFPGRLEDETVTGVLLFALCSRIVQRRDALLGHVKTTTTQY